MRIYGGSYERFLFGFEIEAKGDGKFAIEQVLSMPAHKSAVKCMATCGNLVVTGGADDQVHLFDMHTSRDMGYLVNPAEGPVPCVEFVRPPGAARATHILSGSVGGEICIWKADGDWELVKTMKGHKGAVNSLAAHPSGSLALSVSRDKQMRLWDLTKGSCAYQAPLGSEGDVVGFFPEGDTYFISSSDPSSAKGSNVSIHNTQGATLAVLPHPRKVLCATAADATTLLAGCDGGCLVIWDTEEPQQPLATIEKAHASRVRGITAPFALPGAPGPCIATTSSDGTVKVWDLEGLREGVEEPLAVADVGARFTCMCAFDERAAARDSAAAGEAAARAGENAAEAVSPPGAGGAAVLATAAGGSTSGDSDGAAGGGAEDVAEGEPQGGAAVARGAGPPSNGGAAGPGGTGAMGKKGQKKGAKHGAGGKAKKTGVRSHGEGGKAGGGKRNGKLGVKNGSEVAKMKGGKGVKKGAQGGGARGKGQGGPGAGKRG